MFHIFVQKYFSFLCKNSSHLLQEYFTFFSKSNSNFLQKYFSFFSKNKYHVVPKNIGEKMKYFWSKCESFLEKNANHLWRKIWNIFGEIFNGTIIILKNSTKKICFFVENIFSKNTPVKVYFHRVKVYFRGFAVKRNQNSFL